MITQLDLAILDWIRHTLHCGFLDFLMPLITLFGEDGIFWIAMALILTAIPKTRKIGFGMVLALALDYLLCNLLIKPLVARPRPWTHRPGLEEELKLLVKLPTDYSFPSGHTAASFASASAIFFRTRKWGVPALILAALIGLSRLYLYVHFPTDVLCGALLGILCGFAAVWMVRQLRQDRNLQES